MQHYVCGSASMRMASWVLLGLAQAWAAAAGAAVAFTPGDMLVARQRFQNGETTLLHEYTPAGVRVQTIPVGVSQAVRGVAVDGHGRAVIYYGTFAPSLWVYDPATGRSSSQTFAGWSSSNTTRYGGLGVYSHYAFATDMSTANGGEAAGIVRFDLDGGPALRMGAPDYRQLTVGLDGLIYALQGGTSPESTEVDVYNPLTTALVRSFNMPENLDALAVAKTGDIFAIQGNGDAIHYTPALTVVKRMNINFFGGYRDVALSPTGQIAIASSGGMVLYTDTSLNGYTNFHAGYNDTNNSLGNTETEAITFVPEPAGGLMLVGAAAAMSRRRHRRRDIAA